MDRTDRDTQAARAALRVQLIPQARAAQATEGQIITDPYRWGLVAVLAQAAYPQIYYPSPEVAAKWGYTDPAEAFERGWKNTRAQFHHRRGVVRPFGPIRATFFDNDVPGFAGTRLLWPELIAPPPQPGRKVFICAFDRDLLVAVEGADAESAAMLHLLWQIRVSREGYPHALLPDTPLSLTPGGKLIRIEFKRPDAGLLVPL